MSIHTVTRREHGVSVTTYRVEADTPEAAVALAMRYATGDALVRLRHGVEETDSDFVPDDRAVEWEATS